MTPAIILPPREVFSTQGAGAVALLVWQLARGTDAVVHAMPAAQPFAGVTFRPVAPLLRPAKLAMRYAAGVLAELRRSRPTLVEVHNRPDIALYLAKKLPDSPVMLFLHNDPQGMRGARTQAERLVLLSRLAGVATVSAFLRSRLLEGINDAPEVSVFPNFVDLAAMPKSAPDNVILFAGRVVADKGADAFVAACAIALAQLPGWRAEMIGADRFGADSPDTRFLRDLRPRAARAGVAMHGWQPHEFVLQAMARAAIVVVPSRWPEPFGLTALEAMACGSAVLCAPRGGLVEVMGQGALLGACAINPDDPGDIAQTIVALAADPASREALSRAGLARAALFSVDAARMRLADLRADVLARWSNHRPHPI